MALLTGGVEGAQSALETSGIERNSGPEASGSDDPQSESPTGGQEGAQQEAARRLYTASLVGDVEGAQSALETSGVESSLDRKGSSALHLAAVEGHLNLVKFLVEQGAEVEVTNNDGFTPLHAAAAKGYMEIVKFLVEQGAGIEVTSNDGSTPLHMAAENDHIEIVEFLVVKRGAQLEVTNNDGQTPLCRAAMLGHTEVVRFLVDRGADLEISLEDVPLLHMVIIASGIVALRQIETVRFLVEEKGVDPNIKNSHEKTPLHAAAIVGHIEIARFLVKHGAGVNVRDDKLQTPLHLAAEAGHMEVVQFLVEHGAEVNVRDTNEQTALHMAAGDGHRRVVAYLISRGAEIDVKATCNLTPLHLASLNGKKEVVKLLVEHGAEVKARTMGATAQEIAKQRGHRAIVAYFENGDYRKKLDFIRALDEGDYQQAIRLIERGEIKVSTPIYEGSTLLHVVAERGNQELLAREGIRTFLYNSNIDDWKEATHTQTPDGLTPLHVAAKNGYKDIAELLLYGKPALDVLNDESTLLKDRKERMGQRAVQYMHRAINLLDEGGRTPLHLAAQNGHLEIVKGLVEFAALVENMGGKTRMTGPEWTSYVERKDKDGHTASELAKDNNHKRIAKYFNSLEYSCCLFFFKQCIGKVETVELSGSALGTGLKVGMRFN